MIGPRVWAITKKIKWGDKIDGLNPLDENLTSHKNFISTIHFYEIFFYMNEFNKQRKNLHLIKLSLYERRKQTFKKVVKNVISHISFNVKLSRLNLFLYETYLHSFRLFILLTCLWTNSLFWRHTVLILNGAHYLRRGNEISVLPRLMP